MYQVPVLTPFTRADSAHASSRACAHASSRACIRSVHTPASTQDQSLLVGTASAHGIALAGSSVAFSLPASGVTSPPSCPAFPRTGLCSPDFACAARTIALRYYAGSDSYRARTPPTGLSAYSRRRPSIPPPAIHWRRETLPVTERVALCMGFARPPKARRTTRPKRVRYPAGCSFASGCFPPRITATQLPSATKVVTSFDPDLHRADCVTSRTHGGRDGARP